MPRDGLMMVASCSKGITATVVAMLVERGLLDPGERVAAYWSEFAANGQEQATIEMVAAQIVGLPYPPLGTGLQGLDEHRGEAVTKALAAAPPLWARGTATAYHPVTYGTLLDEIVRRATGVSVARHVQTLIAEPLDVDMWMGLPEQLISRVVPGLWEAASPMDQPRRRPCPAATRPCASSSSGQNLTNWVQGTRAREDDRRTNGDRNCETASALSAFDKRNWASDAPAGTATTSTGSEIMIVGDFGTGYTIVDRIAMTMEIVQHFVWAD
jgi:CubicO group peptidase (beta-lactamase class C family)